MSDVQALLFARALARRLSPGALAALDVHLPRPQRFDLLRHELPSASMAERIAVLCGVSARATAR